MPSPYMKMQRACNGQQLQKKGCRANGMYKRKSRTAWNAMPRM